MYNGPRAGYAATRGRAFPILGRRGLTVSAISGIDMALWDLARPLARRAGRRPVGRAVPRRHGRCTPAAAGPTPTASAPSSARYVAAGFGAVKMRVGVIDGTVDASVARVAAARAALGAGVELMVDAHGTFSVAEAKRFAAGVEPLGVRWFEEPVSADDRRGAGGGAGVDARGHRRRRERVHPLRLPRPDRARAPSTCCSPTWRSAADRREGRRIAALAEAHQLELAPHCWGSALSFSAGVSLAFASPAATVIEYSLGANPLLHDLVDEAVTVERGRRRCPDVAGPRGDAPTPTSSTSSPYVPARGG